MKYREQSRAVHRRLHLQGKRGRLEEPFLPPSCIALPKSALKTFKNFLQRLTVLHSSIFANYSVSFNAAKQSSHMQHSSCPRSHWGKWYRCWRAFWQLPALQQDFTSLERTATCSQGEPQHRSQQRNTVLQLTLLSSPVTKLTAW